ncbi:glycoside hydrolase superfamily [Kalaharituber pfeilii]|nr:glycoside hydrolase superfamily [Kalaharituber pfeilii]
MKISVASVYISILLASAGKGANSGLPDASPPYYSTPKGGWLSEWTPSYQKASALVGQMTLAEKVNVTTSIGWSMGKCVGNTGPVSTQIPLHLRSRRSCRRQISGFDYSVPAGITTGATWNKQLIYQRAYAMGQEAQGKGVHVLLALVNSEGFGSDEYLQGWGARESVLVLVPHYIANEQEHFRGGAHMASTISSNVDDRTMHETYLWPLSEAVGAGVASVMCSYNMINGSYGCQNSLLLNGILNELGFQGYVMADGLAQRSGVGAALACMDYTQPGDRVSWANGASLWGPELSRAVLNGSVPVDRLNDMATRVVAAWNFPSTSFSSLTKSDYDVRYKGVGTGPCIKVNDHINVETNHKDVARAVASEGIVLLKNEGNVLPLSTSDIIRDFGSDAGPNPNGPHSCNDRGCNSGVLGMGWGVIPYSGLPIPHHPIEAIQARANNTTSMASTANAKCLDFISYDSGEGYITAVAGACTNTIVVIHSVGPIIVEAWADLLNFGIADVLFGDKSPSGELPYTMGEMESDWGTSRSGSAAPQPFTEGLYNNIEPRYPFGYGLTYSTFSFSSMSITQVTALTEAPPAPPSKLAVPTYPTTILPASQVTWSAVIQARIPKYIYPYLDTLAASPPGNHPYRAGYSTTERPLPPSGGGQGGNPALRNVMFRVSVTVKNTGSKRTKEHPGYDTPIRQLRDIEKVDLAAGEEKVVTSELTRKDLSVWDILRQNLIIPQAGARGFTVHIGNSSRSKENQSDSWPS